jgi:hypothetical protein
VDESEEGKKDRLLAIKKAVQSFPPGSAAGPSGLKANHLQDIVRTESCSSALLLSALDGFCTMCLSGGLPLPMAPYFVGARLIPLKKGDGGSDVRPIAVGEILRRLVGKVAMASSPFIAAFHDLTPITN